MEKTTNGKGNNISRDMWETPKELWDILNNQYNFNFDCCASVINHKTYQYTVNFLEFVNKDDHLCWMNPPFSKAEKMFNHFFTVVRKGIAIYRADNFEIKIWQENIFPYADWVFIPNRRIVYEGMEGKGARFPSALIGIGVDVPEYLEGVILKVHKSGKR